MNIDISAPRTQGWAAAGPDGGDTAYRTQSLKFVPVEVNLDESVSLWTLFQLWARAAIISSVVWFTAFMIFLVMLFIAGIGSLSPSGSDGFGGSDTSGPQAGVTLASYIFLFGEILAFVIFWLVLLLPQAEEPISEWRTLLEDKAAAAPSAYAAIYAALGRRRIPINASAIRIRSDVLTRDVVNNRLVLRDGRYVAFVTVFGYGTSLYIGWSMYRHRRGAVLIGNFFKDLIGSIMGRSGLTNQMLRTEKVRAMREALHAAVREGVDAAVRGIEVPIAATFGQEVPIQDLTVPAGGTPVMVAPGAGQWAPSPTSAPPASQYTGPRPAYPASPHSTGELSTGQYGQYTTGQIPVAPASGPPASPTSAPPTSGPPAGYPPAGS